MHVHLNQFQMDDEPVVLTYVDHKSIPCKLHTHDFVEIFYIEEGTGTHTIANYSYPIYKGDLCLINTLSPHKHEPIREHTLKVINCLIDKTYLEYLCVEYSSIISQSIKQMLSTRIYDYYTDMKMKRKNMQRVFLLLTAMFEHFSKRPTSWKKQIELYVILLLNEIAIAVNENYEPGKKQKIAQQTLSYILEHKNSPFSIKELALTLGYNDKYILRVFKEIYGTTVLSYVQKLRIEFAMKQLLSTNMSISAIAHNVGYEDLSFFYTLFKRHTGLLPGTYRNQNLLKRNINNISEVCT